MLYTAKEAHVVIRWCDMSASDIADCLGVSIKKAKTLKETPRSLHTGQVEVLADRMGKDPFLLVDELIRSNAPCVADELNV